VRKIEDQQIDSKVYRTDKRMIVSNDTLQEEGRVPGPLSLPPGRLFFGFKHVPYKPPPSTDTQEASRSISPKPQQAFTGEGSSLSGSNSRRPARTPAAPGSSSQPQKPPSTSHDWGTGSSLANSSRKPQTVKKKERSPTPDYGVDSDEDVIEIDSD